MLGYFSFGTLVQPLGLNQLAYGDTDEERIRTFKRRVAANLRHQLLPLMLDPRLRYNHRLVNKTIDLGSAKARAQYNSGLMHDGTDELKRLQVLNQNIAIVCGANDKLFPPREIAATLAEHEIEIEIRTVKGVPHSPLATKHGLRLLEAALEV